MKLQPIMNVFEIKALRLTFAFLSVAFGGVAIAQTPPPSTGEIDAGALQQGLERQLPSPSPLTLLEPTERDSQRAAPTSQSAVTFEVKPFVLEGVSILPADTVQAVLKSWLDRAVSFDDLQKACDAVVELYRKMATQSKLYCPHKKLPMVL
ncbi:hypothetical protein [Polynucleobacter necessarius]|uniref:hypothetical protein n=1 Tax=Polynucleobacter necessarius TaxID=576610 RepID=UPI0013B054F1|nr:hypothetical protein [Polynucleobacter necessarius]